MRCLTETDDGLATKNVPAEGVRANRGGDASSAGARPAESVHGAIVTILTRSADTWSAVTGFEHEVALDEGAPATR
ncbi:MAG: hypothetical protein ACTHK2_14675 [Dokdonella sp.]|uniref:hypothetical protein n=1 Tax=Dokdonella sp. TaxID=2291710 RepID=UPI003F81DC41